MHNNKLNEKAGEGLIKDNNIDKNQLKKGRKIDKPASKNGLQEVRQKTIFIV